MSESLHATLKNPLLHFWPKIEVQCSTLTMKKQDN
jgi:hypothetical protein